MSEADEFGLSAIAEWAWMRRKSCELYGAGRAGLAFRERLHDVMFLIRPDLARDFTDRLRELVDAKAVGDIPVGR